MAKSVDDLMTSQSIERHECHDFEMLDSKIACALKRIITNQYIRRRIHVEEQQAQKYDTLSVEDRLLIRSRNTFALLALMKRFAVYQICSMSLYKEMTFRISFLGGTNLQVKYLKNVLESLYKMKIRESVQLEIVLAMYDQVLDRDRSMLSYQKLKTMVKRHIDKSIKTRNVRARNERIETGVLVKSHKGRKVSFEREAGECYKWRATGQYARGDSYSFSHGTNRGQKAQLSSLAPKRPKHRLTEESPRKVLVPGDKVLLEKKARSVQKKSQREVCGSAVQSLASSRMAKLQI